MVKQTIQIFVRVKPTKSKTGLYECTDVDGVPVVSFIVPKDLAHDFVNNKKEVYKFKFDQVFDQKTHQDEIFEAVARPVIDNVLQGYNGTIFAYGQTGSGKTFTITGGAEKFADRGIIPRTLSYIFETYKKTPECEFTTYVSYLEIYNDSGYDLLDPQHEASKLEDLPKVNLMEDADQNIHLKNLSTHQAANEEDALNLLFMGDTNRMIAETPMNQASTRSHCIFTIHITSREPGSATIRKSKLHLVDLAGSERVGKTGVNGTLLTEAKYINLSLHYLEQVIVALSEKARSHIPYRNSMMTSVLRDSLGGNCMTTMIATVAVDKKNIDESVSTCRFAQRVALIKNDAILNEELDPKLMILRLKKEVQSLKEELALATGEQRTDELTDEEIQRCREAVRNYLDDSDPEAILSVGADMRKIQLCFKLLKAEAQSQSQTQVNSPSPEREETPRDAADPKVVTRLKGLLMQRDNEINILVNMLKKEKKRAADAITALEKSGRPLPRSADITNESVASMSTYNQTQDSGFLSDTRRESGHPPHVSNGSLSSTSSSSSTWTDDRTRERDERTKHKILGDMSMGRQEAFEIFKRDYEQNSAIDENKALLKTRYADAKKNGEKVNSSRMKINKLKTSIEQYRTSRIMQGLTDPNNPEPDDWEDEMSQDLEMEKNNYKETFNHLRSLRTEIEHLQHLLEKSKVKLMKDFEFWWTEQMASSQNKSSGVDSDRRSDVRRNGHRKELRQTESHGDLSGRQASSRSSRSSGRNAVPVTGDPQADADIMAFFQAREKYAKSAQHDGR